MNRDFRSDFSRDTAQRRLDYFRALDAAVDAADAVRHIHTATPSPRPRQAHAEICFGILLSAHIQFAKAQLAVENEEATTVSQDSPR